MVLGLAEDALGATQHDRHTPNGQAVPDHPLLAPSVLNVHRDGGGVSHVPQTAVVRGDRLGNAV